MEDKEAIILAGGFQEDKGRPEKIFAEMTMDFLEDLSKEIRKNPQTSAQEEVVSFAFWCRRRQLEQWKNQYARNQIRMGKGTIFHVAPSNIPTLFAYTMAFGMLSGNGNIVRVSNRIVKDILPLCQVIETVMSRSKYRGLYEKNVVLTYEAKEELTKKYSAICHGRVIWGGDETIQNIQEIPVNPGVFDLTFSDRRSIAVFMEDWMEQQDEDSIKQLARRFYNDTFSMDQNACSSPSIIFWIGKKNEDTRKKWWREVYKASKDYELTPWKVSRKYEEIALIALKHNELGNFQSYGNRLYVTELFHKPINVEKYHGQFGCFYEYQLNQIQELGECLSRKVQTILYAGEIKEAIADIIVTSGAKGGDRIVPVGQGLTMTPVWDGVDIIETLSRIVDVR